MSYNAKLQGEWFDPSKLEVRGNRDGFGEALVELGSKSENVVALAADLSESTRTNLFAKEYPDRFFQVGVAEQNLMGVSAGLAISGKIPFAASYAVFSPGRNWDQLRVSVCYSRANVKIVGGHTGISVGPDGATHQALEDIAITRVLPNLTVLVPSDFEEAKKATHAAANIEGPVYIRLSRIKSPLYTTKETPFEVGKSNLLYEGSDITIVATGIMVYKALQAAHMLSQEGIMADVLNIHTIKPIDAEGVLKSLSKTGRLLTVEEHQIHGGLGSAVLEAVAGQFKGSVQMMGMPDMFGESGEHDELLRKYGLTASKIYWNVKNIIS